MRLSEVIHTLGVVEHHQNHRNHSDGEEVGSEELTEDITVQNLQSRPRKFYFIHTQNFLNSLPAHLGAALLQTATEFLDHLRLPLRPVARDDMLARLAHQPEVEGDVM